MTAEHDALVDAVDRCLPQTQCTQCDYPRCHDYARAIATGEAEINQCPPGETTTIAALARLTGRAVLPPNPTHGAHKPRRVAFIDEADCIGCKLCIQACPVDCIIGAAKWMHAVIAADCSGCELCLPVCPTDCISLRPPPLEDGAASQWAGFSRRLVEQSRRRTRQKQARLAAAAGTAAVARGSLRREALQAEMAAVLAAAGTTSTPPASTATSPPATPTPPPNPPTKP